MTNNKKFKIILCSVASLGIAFSATNFDYVYSHSININEQKEKISGLKKHSEELSKDLAKVQKNINEETRNKDDIDTKIKDLQEKIDRSNENINCLRNQMLEIENNITKIQQEIDKEIALLREALDKMYKASDVSTIEIIFNSKSFGDFLEKNDIVKSVSDTVDGMIKNLQDRCADLEKEKAKVDDIKKQQEEENNNLEKNRGELQNLLSESEELLSQYKNSEEKTKQQISENEAAIKAADDEIRRYYEEQRRREKEELAKRKQKNTNLGFALGTASKVVNQGGFIWPVPGFRRISSDFNDTEGRKSMHGAIDIAGSPGRPIYGANVVASGSGTVISAVHSNIGYGNTIVVDHGNGISTRYSHLSAIAVSKGQKVSRGQVVGQVGSTGKSTGPHLDFTFMVNGIKHDPQNYVRP